MLFRCWKSMLLGLVLALPAASAGGRALLAPDSSSPGSWPFQAFLEAFRNRAQSPNAVVRLLFGWQVQRHWLCWFHLARGCRHRGLHKRLAACAHLQRVLRAGQALFQRHLYPRFVRCATLAAECGNRLGSRCKLPLVPRSTTLCSAYAPNNSGCPPSSRGVFPGVGCTLTWGGVASTTELCACGSPCARGLARRRCCARTATC